MLQRRIEVSPFDAIVPRKVTDGTGFTLSVNLGNVVSIYDRSGMSIGPTSIIDSNGNSIFFGDCLLDALQELIGGPGGVEEGSLLSSKDRFVFRR